MATNNLADIEELLARVHRLEDAEAIRRLQYAYCKHMDGGFDAAALASLWAEDGVWDGGPFGRHVGKAAIFDYFTKHALEVTFAAHFVANEEIDVAGDRATSRSIGIVPVSLIMEGIEADKWMFVTWENTFVKTGGRWLFQSLGATVNKLWSHVEPLEPAA